ncbi:hypothetical protein INR49_030014 [Caranx melampygus]|nr:hypothetical protein INR49_030014 [Caranx melampygus]
MEIYTASLCEWKGGLWGGGGVSAFKSRGGSQSRRIVWLRRERSGKEDERKMDPASLCHAVTSEEKCVCPESFNPARLSAFRPTEVFQLNCRQMWKQLLVSPHEEPELTTYLDTDDSSMPPFIHLSTLSTC